MRGLVSEAQRAALWGAILSKLAEAMLLETDGESLCHLVSNLCAPRRALPRYSVRRKREHHTACVATPPPLRRLGACTTARGLAREVPLNSYSRITHSRELTHTSSRMRSRNVPAGYTCACVRVHRSECVEAAKSDETQMRLLAHLVIKLIANSRERRAMADKYAAEHGADANGEDDDEDEEDAWQDEARLMKRPNSTCLPLAYCTSA